MNVRKSVVFAAALTVLLAAAAACTKASGPAGGSAAGSPSPAVSPSPSPSADPVAAISTAIKALATTPFKVTAKRTATDSNVTNVGAIDPVAKNATVTTNATANGQSYSVEAMLIGTERYVRFTGMPIAELNSKLWNHVDTAKIGSVKDLSVESLTDPSGVDNFAPAIVSATKSGPGQYHGTFNLTKAPDATDLSDADVTSLGAAASSIPFDATVDGQGRLSSLSFTVPAHGSAAPATFTSTFTDLGNPIVVTKPAADQVREAPSNVYDLLNQ